MTQTQIALAVGVLATLSGLLATRAFRFGPTPLAVTYRRLYSNRRSTATPQSSAWDRRFARLGARVAASAIGDRFETRHRYALHAAGVSVTALATRIVAVAVVGFVFALVAATLPFTLGYSIPLVVTVAAPFAIGGLAGWYRLQAVLSAAAARHREFRAGVAAYIQLVSVCMTTRRSMTEAITYAADVGAGAAFETISAAVHAAPQMGLRVWEALDSVGVEYDTRELQDLASSVGHVARIGVGVESTVTAVATRMRQVALDDMQRDADRQTSSMFGPTMVFVLGTVAFLAYPLALRVLDAFSTT